MMRALFVFLALVLAAVAVAVEGVAPVTTAVEADQQAALGLQVLQASDTNPRQTVAAALAFTSALGFYRAQGDTDRVCELQASLYWCKKRMTLEDVQAFLVARGQDEGLAKLAEQMATATATTVPKEEAAAYFSRAEKYAQQHPMDYLQVAIRYFEVADRFQGTDVSLTAQRRSLDAQRQAIQGDGSASKIAHELPAAVAVAGDLPPAAGKIISDFNAAAAIISKSAASEVAKEERRLTDSLGKDAESQQRQGNLEAMIASQRQMSNADRDQTGLSKTAQSAVDSYRAARGKVIARAQESIAKEQAKVVRVLEGAQSEETKKGNVSGALAIKGKRDELSAIVSRLTIVSAKFGIDGGRWIDVTEFIKKRIKDGALNFTHDDAFCKGLEDPALGETKSFVIVYKIGTAQSAVSVQKHSSLSIGGGEKLALFNAAIIGKWSVSKPGWTSVIALSKDGTATSSGGDAGAWSIRNNVIRITWKNLSGWEEINLDGTPGDSWTGKSTVSGKRISD